MADTDPWENENDGRYVEQRKYTIQALHNQHHEMLLRSAIGQSNKEIAEALGITSQTVSNTINSPIARQKLAELREKMYEETADIATRIQEFAPKALDLLEEIIDGKHADATVALRAKYASLHLGRAGFGEVKKNINVSTTLNKEEISAIKDRAIEAAKASGIIDAEYIDNSN